MTSYKFTLDDPCCYGNDISHKISYNSLCVRDIAEHLARSRGFQGRAIE